MILEGRSRINGAKLIAGCVIPLVFATGCVVGDSASEPTATTRPVFQIVTPTNVPTVTPRTDVVEYTVQDGDTLFEIAVQFDILPEAVIEANNLANPDSIFVGQRLVIPPPVQVTPEG